MSEHLCCVHVCLLRCQTVTTCTREQPLGSLSLILIGIWAAPEGTRPQPRTSWTYFVFSPPAGMFPTTVLGQIQSPDLDDWSQKFYRFEGKPSR